MSGNFTGVAPETPSKPATPSILSRNKVAPKPAELTPVGSMDETLKVEECEGSLVAEAAPAKAPKRASISEDAVPHPSRAAALAGVPSPMGAATNWSANGGAAIREEGKRKRSIFGVPKEEWYEPMHEHGEHGEPTWWNVPWHAVPLMRHAWGDPQYEVHPGGQELFLDLIFVLLLVACSL